MYEQDHKPVKCTSEASVPRTHTTDADATGRISAHCPFEACTSPVPHNPTSLLQAWKITQSPSSTPSTLGTHFSLAASTGRAPYAQVRHHPHRFLLAVLYNIINRLKYNNGKINDRNIIKSPCLYPINASHQLKLAHPHTPTLDHCWYVISVLSVTSTPAVQGGHPICPLVDTIPQRSAFVGHARCSRYRVVLSW